MISDHSLRPKGFMEIGAKNSQNQSYFKVSNMGKPGMGVDKQVNRKRRSIYAVVL